MPGNNLGELELSVFMPAFNEEGNINKTIYDADKVLRGLGLKNYEIIVVNDGSKDKTADVVSDIAQKNKNVRLVNHEVNLGYGKALKTGFESAKFGWVAFVDSDGQFNFSEINKFLEKVNECDVVLGYRLNRADPFRRRVFTWGWKMLAMAVLGLNVRDYSCGFKLFKKRVWEEIKPIWSEEKVTQIEMLIKAKRLKFKFCEVGVRHYPRVHGVATGAKLSVVMRSFLDMMKLWKDLNFGNSKFT